jgi:pilus assembly protein CpaE
MLAGARHFLVKPFADSELIDGIRSVYRLDAGRRAAGSAPAAAPATPAAPSVRSGPAAREGKVFTFYSAKGGAGCTTLACNTAIALKRLTNKAVAIFDCGLLFGDVGVVLNLDPRTTLVDVIPQMQAHPGPLDPEFLSQMMATHSSGVKVLLAPSSPEKAELVAPEHIHRVLVALREQFDYLVIDTWPTFEERILGVLDAADQIVVPTTLEMPAIKNCKLLLEVASALAYPPEKVMMVLNRADSRGGIRVQDVEGILQKRFAVEVVSDGRLTTASLNEGVPFIMTQPDAPISRDITRLASTLAGVTERAVEEAKPRRKGLFRVLGA